MCEKNIRVGVSGVAGVGLNTVAVKIAQVLKEAGFEVVDAPVLEKEEYLPNLGERLAAIGKNVPVKVRTKYLPKQAVSDDSDPVESVE